MWAVIDGHCSDPFIMSLQNDILILSFFIHLFVGKILKRETLFWLFGYTETSFVLFKHNKLIPWHSLKVINEFSFCYHTELTDLNILDMF